MARLLFNDSELRELRRQCLHHNVFPLFLGHCMGGEPPVVYAVLKPIVDDCVNQLMKMSFDEVKPIVDSVPAGYRTMVEPVESPLTPEYLTRVAEYCVAAELQKGYSPVSDVIQPKPHDSEVLAICPKLRSQMDDDGLLILGDDFVLLDGGIRYGEYFLHYHQFLRRGFSSNPNFDFLGKLARYRRDTRDANTFRIAIDHRRIMKFDDYRQVMELDTWYGPKFDRDKLDDPNLVGLTVVGRIHPNSLDSYPLEKTEFFWKTNEGESVKTLEIEELSAASNPYENWHINRYVHAERDMLNRTFRHFDGAAKVYAQHNYHERISQTMPKNACPAHYTKLFRIDGAIDLDDWLGLVSMFYKGNEMVIEYFDPKLFNEKFRPIRERMYNALSQ
jgi:hypothetical protein